MGKTTKKGACPEHTGKRAPPGNGGVDGGHETGDGGSLLGFFVVRVDSHNHQILLKGKRFFTFNTKTLNGHET